MRLSPAGLLNTVLPFVVFSANYLIIPFSRPEVVLVETIPFLAVKALVPPLLSYLPYWFRPPFIAFGWILAAVITWAAAPNVEPRPRVLACVIASIAAAFTDSSFLGLLTYYGKPGLVGWGAGTGAGYVLCALLPFVATVGMGMTLRQVNDYVYYAAVLIVLVYMFVLPRGRLARPRIAKLRDRQESIADEEGSLSLLAQDSRASPRSLPNRFRHAFSLLKALGGPYIAPLCLAIGVECIIFPGITRLFRTSSSFHTFVRYSAFYGLAFQLGNLIGRSSVLFIRFQKPRGLLIRQGIIAAVLVTNTALLLVSLSAVVFAVVSCLGLITGAVYINLIASAMEEPTHETLGERELILGLVGTGEGAGWLLGGLIAAVLETSICGMSIGRRQRWCNAVR